MGISRSGFGVLLVRSGDSLGISRSGHGEPGTFDGLLGLKGPLLAALVASELPRSPKGLTVAVTYSAMRGACSPKALTVVLARDRHILPIR